MKSASYHGTSYRASLYLDVVINTENCLIRTDNTPVLRRSVNKHTRPAAATIVAAVGFIILRDRSTKLQRMLAAPQSWEHLVNLIGKVLIDTAPPLVLFPPPLPPLWEFRKPPQRASELFDSPWKETERYSVFGASERTSELGQAGVCFYLETNRFLQRDLPTSLRMFVIGAWMPIQSADGSIDNKWGTTRHTSVTYAVGKTDFLPQ
ncbi:hypothetical protein CBL_06015 [Carabus blaptoides fortunei]